METPVAPFSVDYEINTFTSDEKGKYMGQPMGLVQSLNRTVDRSSYKQVILIDQNSKETLLANNIQK